MVYFIASLLKPLKRYFGNPLFVADLKFKQIRDKPQITGNHRTTGKKTFNNDLNEAVTEHVTKEVQILPSYLRHKF